MTGGLAFPPCPWCGCGSPSWDGTGTTTRGAYDAWSCPRCGHEWREHFPHPQHNPDSGPGPCARCGRVFDERDDRPYCPACEDGPHEKLDGGEW